MARNGSLDIARLLAAFGILLFHAKSPGGNIGYSGLAFFLMALLFLSLHSAAQRSFTTFAHDRARRLLHPWLIWSAMYGLLKVADVLLTKKTLQSEFSLSMLLTGPALHLWFLPFAFVISLFLPSMIRFRQKSRPACKWLLTASCLALCIFGLGWQHAKNLPVPLVQYFYMLPSVGLGLVIGLNWNTIADRKIIILVSSACLLLGAGLGYHGGLLQLSVAYAALLLCLGLPLPDTEFSRLCARLSMNVYLVHPLILSLLNRGLHLHEHSVAMGLAGISASLMAALVLDRYAQFSERQGKTNDSNPSH